MILAPTHQLRWGLGLAAVAILIVAILAFVPDPFFRQQTLSTRFDDVEAVMPGGSVYFRGAEIGQVRSVALDPATRLFDVRLGVRRDWRPTACSFARISGSNPLAAPRIELVAIEPGATACPAAEAAAGCTPLTASGARRAITGCMRPPDLFETAAAAVNEAGAVAHMVNLMATRFGAGGGAGAASGFDLARVTQQSTAALAALSTIAQRLNTGFDPGHGDIALTIANVRRASGRAGEFDMASLNATLRQVQALVAQNQANVAGMLADTRATTAETRNLLETLSASLGQTSGNLATATGSLSALSERLSADPTFAIRGAKFADPPPPGSKP